MTEKPGEEASLFLAIESLCDAFESALQTEQSPKIEDYLDKVARHQKTALLRELCLIEIQYRIERKDEVTLAEYFERFPAQKEVLELLLRGNPRLHFGASEANPGETVVRHAPDEFTNFSNWQSFDTVRSEEKRNIPESTPKTMFGGYQLIEKIGQGGMGVIYKARQQKPNRIVAVKMIRAGKLAAPADIQRFQSEAEAIGRLAHPHIVPIYEVGQVDGIHFFSMAYVDGEDLAQKMQQGPLPQRQAAHLVCEIALAISYAHQQGIIHRDLKPANILLTRDGQIRVTDFGLAKLQDAERGQTVTGDVVGTPGYMSPEQAAGQRISVGTASDIYSLGAILYCLLTGRPPFQAATVVDTLFQVINDNPVSPRQVNPSLDRDLETICLKCLEKTTNRRYPTAIALSTELERFVNGHPIEARPLNLFSRFWRWGRRRPKLAVAWSMVAALLLFLSIAGPLAAIHQRQLKTAANESANHALQSAAKYRQEQVRANAIATEAAHSLYDTRILLARSSLQNNDTAYARQLLNIYHTPENGTDYRGFEWHFLNQQLHQEISSIEAHAGFSIEDLAIAPQSSPIEFATLSKAELRIWRIDGTIRLTKHLESHDGVCLDYNDDGRLLVVGSSKGNLCFYDVEKLKLEKQIKTSPEGIDMIDLLPGGKTCIVRNSKRDILSVKVDTGEVKVIRKSSDRWAWDGKFACSNDGKWLGFIDGRQQVGLRNLEQDDSKVRFNPVFSNYAGGSGLAISSNGRMLAYGNSRGRMSVWSPSTTYSMHKLYDHAGAIEHMAVTPDNRLIVSAGKDRAIRLASVHDQKIKRVLYGHEERVTCLSVTSNSEFVVSGDKGGHVKVFSLNDKRNERTHINPEGHGIAFHPQKSRYALAKTNATLEIWECGASKPARILSGHGKGVTTKPSGRSVKWLAFHPQGNELAAGLVDGTICTWNPETGEFLRSWKAHDSAIFSLSYSPDGTKIASISNKDENLKIWHTSSAKLLQTIPFIPYDSRLSWNTTGTRIVSGTSRFRSFLIDVASGENIIVLPGEHGIHSPDGKHILYVQNDEKRRRNTIIICDALTGQETGILKGNTARIYDFTITADCQRVISLDTEGMIVIWNMNTGNQLLNLRAPEGYNGGRLCVGPQGRNLAYNLGRSKIWFTQIKSESARSD